MSTALRQKLYTFEDFCAIIRDDEKADLIDGVVYMASPENMDSNNLLFWFIELLRPFIRKLHLGRLVGSRVAFRLDDSNGPEPDLALIATERLHLLRRGYVNGGPDWAMEFVSPESVDRDYVAKRRKYEQAGVREYWIIDEMQNRATLLRLGRDGTYKEVKPRKGVLESKVLTGFWLRPEWLWQEELPEPEKVLREILAGLPK